MEFIIRYIHDAWHDITTSLMIIGMTIVIAIVYGIVHDQITARICVEYFTIGHPRLIETHDPTLLGLFWGVVASWWVGAILGIAIAFAARYGSRPKIEPSELIPAMGILFVVTAGFAAFSGAVGYLAAERSWVTLNSFLAERVPVERQSLFLADVWSHCASYLCGSVGGVLLIRYILVTRALLKVACLH